MSLGLWAGPFVLVGLAVILWVANKLEYLVELSEFELDDAAIDTVGPREPDTIA